MSVGEAICTYAESDIWSAQFVYAIYNSILSDQPILCRMSFLHILLNLRTSRPEMTVKVLLTLIVDSQVNSRRR
jgi:hypothetical protein